MLILNEILSSCDLINTNAETYLKAIALVTKYDFQIFDSIIVASAPEAGCNTLYSEDMHNGLVVENQLTIRNPFI